MVALAVALVFVQEQTPIVPLDRPGKNGRGRDPWVFRCIFEDRTRMVILALAKDWWVAFNPETCALHKVWRGKMDFRGKVWDFSQDNSRAEGRVYFASPSEIWKLEDDGKLPSGWATTGVSFEKGGWAFASGSGSLSSPVFSAQDWQRVFLAFDETGRNSRFRATIWDERQRIAPQWFDSATHSSSESDWQWNFKLIERPSANMRVRITSPPGHSKRLRGLRMYGDKPSWVDAHGKALPVTWRGYEVKDNACSLRFEVSIGSRTSEIVHWIELSEKGWFEIWEFDSMLGPAPGEERNPYRGLFLRRQGLSTAVQEGSPRIEYPPQHTRLPAKTPPAGWKLQDFGRYRVDYELPEGER